MNKKTSLSCIILAVLACVITITACEPIGYKIERETKLTTAVVTGNVVSMVPVKGTLFVQNGYIYTKDFAGTKPWEKADTAKLAEVIALASDESNLYAKDTSGNIWAAEVADDGKSGNWEKVYENTGSAGSVFLFDNGLFNNDDGTTSGRNAYMRDTTGVKMLKGTGTPVSETGNGAGKSTKNCISIGGSDHFTDGFMVATDGTSIFSVNSEKRDSKACTLQYKKTSDSEWTSVEKKTGNGVTCLFWNGTNLLVGTTKNYETWTVTGNIPVSGTAASDTAATIGTHSILGIWEYGSIRYASIYDEKTSMYNGLWGQPAGKDWDKQ